MKRTQQRLGVWSRSLLFAWLTIGLTPVQAEVVLDGSMQSCEPGCSLTGPDYQINAEQGRLSANNQNLFHSFSDFNLTNAETATFNSSVPVQNIISRVSGPNLSNINGTIRSTVEGANLWLINPHGIVFGASAQLDISGSFHASTADYLLLGSDGRFGADIGNPQNTVLSSSPPSAFGFLDDVVAPISVQGSQLTVPTGKTLSLVAGDIDIIGQGGTATTLDLDTDSVVLRAASGQLNLVSVASAGEATLLGDAVVTGDMALATINLSDGAALTTRGDPGGTIYIRAGRFVMENSILDSATLGDIDHAGNGMDIQVTEEMRLLSGVGSVSGISGGSAIYSSAYGLGSAGNILIETNNLFLQGDPDSTLGPSGAVTSIASRVFGAGNGGSITINSDILQLDKNAAIVTQSFGSGDSNNIDINSRLVNINGTEGLAFISTTAYNSGNAGNLTVMADEVTAQGNNGFVGLATQVTRNGATPAGVVANGGLLTVSANRIVIRDGAQFNSSMYNGYGAGGNIHVTADELQISGVDNNGYSAGILSQVGNFVAGSGGNIEIDVQSLSVSDGGMVSSQSFGFGKAGDISVRADSITLDGINTRGNISGIFASTSAVGGNAGNIDVITRRLAVNNGAQMSTQTFGLGSAGMIDIQADSVSIAGFDLASGSESRITASSEIFEPYAAYAGGQGGGIIINSGEVVISDRGRLTTHTDTIGGGGDILVNATQLSLTGEAEISASSTGSGAAGDISVNAGDTIRLDRSRITSEAATSDGGNITLVAKNALYATGSEISASVAGGNGKGGSIDIQTTEALLNATDIAASSHSTGMAGNIKLVATDVLEMLGSSIATEASQSDGGNISIQVQRFIYLDHSAITASVSGGAGNGGNIFIDPELMVIKSSTITANAHGGNGGNVTIIAGNLITSPDSIISASSEIGVDGEVMIDAPNRDLNNVLVILPESLVDASRLFRNDCAAIAGNYSSFVVSDSLYTGSSLLSPAYYTDQAAMQLARQVDDDQLEDNTSARLAYQRIAEPSIGGCQADRQVF